MRCIFTSEDRPAAPSFLVADQGKQLCPPRASTTEPRPKDTEIR
jgi:hypothetical protein